MPAIEIDGLVKTYGAHRAVDEVSLTVEEGEVFALLGPNGAGKTTTIEILEGYRGRDAGDVRVLGQDPAHADRTFRDRIGILLQSHEVDRVLTVREALDTQRASYRRPRDTDEVIALVGLEAKADARAKTLSGGQQRRLDLALGLIGDPDLIFLDEPTTGFDPSARREAWELVSDLRSLGRTILLTTHYMDEAQALADRLAVISGGQIVAEGTPDTIGGRDHGVTAVSFNLPTADASLEEVFGPLSGKVGVRNGRVQIRTSDPTGDLHHLTSWAVGRGTVLEGLAVERPTLEDVYLDLTASAEPAADPEPTGRRRGRRRRR